MKRFAFAAALLVLTVSAAPAAPAKKWFLAIRIHGHHTYLNNAPITEYLGREFETYGDCDARRRTFRNECRSLIADYDRVMKIGVTEITTSCQRHWVQPKPVFGLWFEQLTSDAMKQEIDCMK